MKRNKDLEKIYLVFAVSFNIILLVPFLFLESYIFISFFSIWYILINILFFYYIIKNIDFLVLSSLITAALFGFFIWGHYKFIAKNETMRVLHDNWIWFQNDIFIQDREQSLTWIENYRFYAIYFALLSVFLISAKLPNKNNIWLK